MSVKDYQGVPDLLKHMTMAVFNKLQGGKEIKMINAYNIARMKLVQAGYLEASAVEGAPEHISLTGTGAQKNAKHKLEGRGKSQAFDGMAWILEQAFIAEKMPLSSQTHEHPQPSDQVIERAAHHRKPIQRSPDRTPPKPPSFFRRVRAAVATKAKTVFAKRAKRA